MSVPPLLLLLLHPCVSLCRLLLDICVGRNGRLELLKVVPSFLQVPFVPFEAHGSVLDVHSSDSSQLTDERVFLGLLALLGLLRNRLTSAGSRLLRHRVGLGRV